MAWRRRRQTDEQLLRLAQFRLAIRLAREDVVTLGRRLDDCQPWLDGEAAAEWKLAAVDHGAAVAALRDVHTLADVLRVHTILREVWFHLARCDAFAFDEAPPESPEPWTFDVQRLRTTRLTDQAETSPIQRHMEIQARGAGGYAQGALYAGPPHPLII